MTQDSGNAPKRAHRRFRPVYLILLIPVFAALWTPFYNRVEPSIAGVPFFYWYQLLWVPLSAIVLFFIYRTEPRDKGRE
ncbi:MAG TPA: DUF3311 domain-containing protein [Rhizomicrobium sp.]|nr:DUF3311 domain-containing protein [Rhizomicrobium sp.]